MCDESKTNDQHARSQSLDVTESFIVQAPAGSGKTELLIQRLLALLCVVHAPHEILAMTFTKKAANEMRDRIIDALKLAQSGVEPESIHQKNTFNIARTVLKKDQSLNWNLIQNPNQLRIQTIDSFCTYITKQLPLVSHLGAEIDITEDPIFLYEETVQEVLSHVEENFEWSESIEKLLLHFDNSLNKLHDLLVNLLSKRDQWFSYLNVNFDEDAVRNQLESYLNVIIHEHLNGVKKLIPHSLIQELTLLSQFAAQQLSLNNDSEIIECQELHPSLFKINNKPNKTEVKIWLGLTKLLLTDQGEWRKSVDQRIGFPSPSSAKNPIEKTIYTQYKSRMKSLLEILCNHDKLRLALSEICFLPSLTYQNYEWDILKALLAILKITVAQLRLTFSNYGQIDFIENAYAAQLALGTPDEPTDLTLSLDYKIQHILIDEFQDTSFIQHQLLEKLTAGWTGEDGRTLFVVGDPMQSIYRFREAEVGLFIKIREQGIGSIKLIPLTLSSNFRSASHIVEWNNQHFSQIFPNFSDMTMGIVPFHKSKSQETSNNKNNNQVIVQGLINADAALQACHIVDLIQSLQESHPEDDIAILVRSRSHLTAILTQLKKRKLNYRAVDIDSLDIHQYIQDLFSLTCALLHPSDRIAWLSILRAPWCGLTLSDLSIIASDHAHLTIIEQLQNDQLIQRLSNDGKIKITKTLTILKNKISERDRCSLHDLVKSTWLQLGGPATLNSEVEFSDISTYFNLLDQNNIIDTDTLRTKLTHLYAQSQHESKLQIMTIHSAKGLEFDTVIIPHLERKLPTDDKTLLSWMEYLLPNDQRALLLAPLSATGSNLNPIYNYIYRQKKIKSTYEKDRLFYVATTRAVKRLYLFFNAERNENGEIISPTGSFLEKFIPCLSNEDYQLILSNQPVRTNTNSQTNKCFYRLSNEWKHPIQNILLSARENHEQGSFYLPNENKKTIGIVVHRLLQLLTQKNIHWWTSQNYFNQRQYILNQLKLAGAGPSDVEKSSEHVYHIIDNIIHDQRGLWILKNHFEAKSEFSITALLNNQNIKMIIDRTFIDENGIRWIIDYKTNAFLQSDLEEFLKKEKEKYQSKLMQYYHAIQLMERRETRLGLYFPALPAWYEWAP